ncbi:MAG: Ribokinase [uncultured Adhaeribacter sp.]|uniref:Ribokinase n=1 Tax=uncultured Adhaeribacter sp. TaxID=448109 RepID=A0A6J4J444_9BACT|nr:MAG: Ribokinase [uncultured Adhaeribacter sp.]
MTDFGKIVVIGSTNTDMVIKSTKLPAPGETLLGGEFFLNLGGKGANQAVAAARLGGQVTFITKVGNDSFGTQAREQFTQEGIRTDFVITDYENASGVALITVNAQGENTIVVAAGANGTLTETDFAAAADEITGAKIILMQLEIPLAVVLAIAARATNVGVKVILNPAPAQELPDPIYPYLYLITPNETEAELLTGIKVDNLEAAQLAARKLKDKGVSLVLITLGSNGALFYDGTTPTHITAPVVKAVDTTAAGDVFNGALAVALAENKSLADAITFANQAAAISVTRFGAQASAPYRAELAAVLTSQ